MKKLLLTMGTITSVIAPVVAAVSCGDKKEDVKPIVAFKIRKLNDMRTALMPGATNIFDAHKNDSLSQINTFIDGTIALTAENKKTLKDFFARTKNVELAINLIKFGLASSDQGTLFLAAMAWKSSDPNTGKAEFLEFILNSTIEFDDVIKGIVGKFTGADSRFDLAKIKLSQLAFDASLKTVTIPSLTHAYWGLAKSGLDAMGGQAVFTFIMQKAGWTVTQLP